MNGSPVCLLQLTLDFVCEIFIANVYYGMWL